MEGKVRQEAYWGGPEWQRSFGRRSRVEATFSLAKSSKGHGVRRGWMHQVGLAKTSFALLLVLAGANIDRLLDWVARNGYDKDPLTQMDVSSEGFLEVGLDVDSLLLPDTEPLPLVA